jgi:zinc-binding alcohol dehydrogenase family protein
MAGISPGNPPGDRPVPARAPETHAAAAAVAVVLAVMAGCGQGSPSTQTRPPRVSTSPAPSSASRATRPHGITDQELRAWAAALPWARRPTSRPYPGGRATCCSSTVDTGSRCPTAPASAQYLAPIVEFCQAAKISTVIDRRYWLNEVPEALRYLGEGHAKGKVVVIVD